jgi:hypothetical protein
VKQFELARVCALRPATVLSGDRLTFARVSYEMDVFALAYTFLWQELK